MIFSDERRVPTVCQTEEGVIVFLSDTRGAVVAVTQRRAAAVTSDKLAPRLTAQQPGVTRQVSAPSGRTVLKITQRYHPLSTYDAWVMDQHGSAWVMEGREVGKGFCVDSNYLSHTLGPTLGTPRPQVPLPNHS